MPEGQHRLYVRGKHVSYTRGKRNTSPNTSLIKIEGCDSTTDAQFYLGKRIAYVYKVCVLLPTQASQMLIARRTDRFGEARSVLFGER